MNSKIIQNSKSIYERFRYGVFSQQRFIHLKPAMETLEQCVKSVQS